MNSANSQGPTDDFSSGVDFELLGTFPRCVMFLLCFSFAMRILCLATIMLLQLTYAPQKGTAAPDTTARSPRAAPCTLR